MSVGNSGILRILHNSQQPTTLNKLISHVGMGGNGEAQFTPMPWTTANYTFSQACIYCNSCQTWLQTSRIPASEDDLEAFAQVDSLQQYVHTTIDHRPPHPQTLTAPKWFKSNTPWLYWSQLTCRPALADRDTAFALALPVSLPALPPSCTQSTYIALNVYTMYSTQQTLYTTVFCYCV